MHDRNSGRLDQAEYRLVWDNPILKVYVNSFEVIWRLDGAQPVRFPVFMFGQICMSVLFALPKTTYQELCKRWRGEQTP